MSRWGIENDDGWFIVYKDGVEVASSENGDHMADVLNDAFHDANARIAELEAERRWIPVSEKPTKSDWYLIMYQGYRVPDAGYYDVEAGWLSDIPTPDCWMPLPEPPEVEK